MNAGTLVFLVVLVAIIGLVVYLATSQSEIPSRFRRLVRLRMNDKNIDAASGRGPRREAGWSGDPDHTDEAREVERVTGIIRSGEAFTIATSDPSFWGANGFDIEGLIVQIAAVQTVDVAGNFQFRYCAVEASGAGPNTIVIEGDSPAAAVAYLARAMMPDDPVGDYRAGQIMEQMRQARQHYKDSGANEMQISIPPYENGTIIAARYDGRLALLESEPGKGYLPLSASSPSGVAYSDMTVRLDPSGWLVRMVEIGAYAFLLEIEPIKLSDLTVHHLDID